MSADGLRLQAVDDGDSTMRSGSEPDLDDAEGSNFNDVANFHITNSHSNEHSLGRLNPVNPADLELSPPASQTSNNSPTQATAASTTRRTLSDREQTTFRMLRNNGGAFAEDSGQKGFRRHGLKGGKHVSMLDPVKLEGHTRDSKKPTPGYVWMNSRAQEEYVAALDKVQDPNWSMRQYLFGTRPFSSFVFFGIVV
ncbi:hypothetical protein GP486_001373 [Trichoglossum hirsutum]|uniref:Uncharacterized protein n=1 Tax=Trichoglossum hirsutum TaxID=265104 RepID=A0A9P8LGY9_9PEZI|nr:hypothetical protein GP486_001373 [Trichoglossum hirsutum]